MNINEIQEMYANLGYLYRQVEHPLTRKLQLARNFKI